MTLHGLRSEPQAVVFCKLDARVDPPLSPPMKVSPRLEPCCCAFSSVPPQPVPPLAKTLQSYLRALEPLLPADELRHTRRIVQEFGRPGGLGAKLQEGLERRARHTRNWVRVGVCVCVGNVTGVVCCVK